MWRCPAIQCQRGWMKRAALKGDTMNMANAGTTRRSVLRVGALALPIVATACGAASSGSGQTQQAASSKPQGKLLIMSRADQSIFDLFKQQVAAFQQENPQIQIDIDHEDQSAWLEKFKTMAAAGTPLDSCFANDSNAVPFARDGLTEDLEPYFAKTKDFKESDFAEGAWFARKYKGKRYGVPGDSGAYALFYNMY